MVLVYTSCAGPGSGPGSPRDLPGLRSSGSTKRSSSPRLAGARHRPGLRALSGHWSHLAKIARTVAVRLFPEPLVAAIGGEQSNEDQLEQGNRYPGSGHPVDASGARIDNGSASGLHDAVYAEIEGWMQGETLIASEIEIKGTRGSPAPEPAPDPAPDPVHGKVLYTTAPALESPALRPAWSASRRSRRWCARRRTGRGAPR